MTEAIADHSRRIAIGFAALVAATGVLVAVDHSSGATTNGSACKSSAAKPVNGGRNTCQPAVSPR